MNDSRKTAAWIIVALASLVLTVWATGAAMRFLEIDSCLDMGGRWNFVDLVCERYAPTQGSLGPG